MRATIEIRCEEGALLRDVLSPETERAIPRTDVKVEGIDDGLRVCIEASDTNALRAAVNSYLRWISVGIEASGLAASVRG